MNFRMPFMTTKLLGSFGSRGWRLSIAELLWVVTPGAELARLRAASLFSARPLGTLASAQEPSAASSAEHRGEPTFWPWLKWWVSVQEVLKCFIFQGGLTDSLSASRSELPFAFPLKQRLPFLWTDFMERTAVLAASSQRSGPCRCSPRAGSGGRPHHVSQTGARANTPLRRPIPQPAMFAAPI